MFLFFFGSRGKENYCFVINIWHIQNLRKLYKRNGEIVCLDFLPSKEQEQNFSRLNSLCVIKVEKQIIRTGKSKSWIFGHINFEKKALDPRFE